MNLGIIYYSQTGNTRSVAERLKVHLESKGHFVDLQEILAEGDVQQPGGKEISLKSKPSAEPYQGVIFASPVQAFSLNPVMKKYLSDLGSLEDKPVACFVTKQLPAAWTGGRAALKYLGRAVETRGGNLLSSGMVVWSSKHREGLIDSLIDKISKGFT